MKIGIVGYPGVGKSTLFEWLTQTASDPSLAHLGQSAVVPIPDPRLDRLRQIYQPKKVTQAGIELVDTPALSRDHQGLAARLAMIREAGCLVVVVPAFNSGDPVSELRQFEEDLLLADLEIVMGRIERVQQSLAKPRPNREELEKELQTLQQVQAALEAGQYLHQLGLTAEQRRTIRSFQLFSEKPRMVIINLADDEPQPERFRNLGLDIPVEPISVRLQWQLDRLPPEERQAFCQEMGVSLVDRGAILRQILRTSGQILFFTAGEKEVRSWMVRQGATAVEAAAAIHTDLAQGFVRAEVFHCEDIFRLGSERELKAHHLIRREPKDYVVQDGDVIFIHHHS